jgi:hypothetical protein
MIGWAELLAELVRWVSFITKEYLCASDYYVGENTYVQLLPLNSSLLLATKFLLRGFRATVRAYKPTADPTILKFEARRPTRDGQ